MFPQRLKELGDELPAGFYNQRWVSQCYALACDQSAAIREATTRIEELKSELAIAEHDHALKDAYIKKLQELLNFAIQSLEALQPILGTSIGEQVQSIVDKIVKGTK
jgi:hypothetical protein